MRHRSCQTLHRKSFTKWIAKFRSKVPVCQWMLRRTNVSQNELQSFAAKVRSCQWTFHRKSFTKWIAKFRSKGPVCQWMLHRKSFRKWIAKFRSKGPVLSVDASPQKFHKMNCKVSQQRSGLVSGCFAEKVSQNELQSFAAKVRSCQWMLRRKSFRKWIAKFRSKGPVLSVDASPQKFHKMNCNVSQQRSVLVSGCFTAKVSQNALQSFAAKVRSCQWTLHRKSFRKWIAKSHSKGPVLSVDASAAQQRSSNVSVDRDVYLVLEILGQKLFFCGSHCASRVSQAFARGSLYRVPLHVCQFAWQARRTRTKIIFNRWL